MKGVSYCNVGFSLLQLRDITVSQLIITSPAIGIAFPSFWLDAMDCVALSMLSHGRAFALEDEPRFVESRLPWVIL
jgi:hypothetical protein